MAEQQFQSIVLELDFKIENASGVHIRDGRDSDWFPNSMLRAELSKFLLVWSDRPQLVPKDALEPGSKYIFRKPTLFETGDLEYIATLATEMLLYGIEDLLRLHGLEYPSDLIQCEAIVIEHLGFGCARARIKYYLKVSGVIVTMLGALGGLVGGLVALDIHFDPPVPAIEASCTVHMQEPKDIGRELRRTIERYPYTWMASGNAACVKLRQQVLNQFLDTQIKDDGFYGGDTSDAENAVAKKVGMEKVTLEELYPFLAERLEKPQSILVFNIPRR